MNKIFLYITIIILGFAPISYADGTDTIVPVPTALPIGSFGQLKSWSIDRVTRGIMLIWADTIVFDQDSKTYVQLDRNEGESPDEFTRRLLNYEFKFKLSDSSDKIQVVVILYGNDNHALFHGSQITRTYALGESKRGFVIEDLELFLAEYIWIPVGSLTDAQINYRDDIGNFQYPLPVTITDGMMKFPSIYAGRKGQIVGSFIDSSGKYQQVAYDLSLTGKQIPFTEISGTVKGFINNYFESKAETGWVEKNIYINPSAKFGDTPPVVRVKVIQGAASIPTVVVNIHMNIIQDGYNIGTAKKASIRSEFAPIDSLTELPVDLNGLVKVTLRPGVYYISLENNKIYRATQPTPNHNQDRPSLEGAG